ncbi:MULTISPECIES: hypothetical protein [Marinobacter]|uniref:DUF7946 domain-containing protein n=1 Tax=Marinobacter TaxID=2742 RepID=UPI00124733F4|nr:MULTISPECIES: hypothetical protein [Marinobacter]MBL3557131.1 hypothetical protein [Marinobacter sp. JB05H06]
MAELKVKFRYQNGTADTGRLGLYNASVALTGVARATSIVTHAYLNGEVRSHGDAAHGAEFYINTPKRGSFTYEAIIWVAGAVSGGVFYDFVKYSFNEAVGKISQPDDMYSQLAKRIEPTIDELPAILESPLSDMHRPIRKEPVMIMDVTRPRGEKLATFDSETALYLLPQTIPAPHQIVGNVTKYNNITGWGRFFDRIEGRTISFNISLKSPESQRELITWSQHENNRGNEGLLYLSADAVVTPTDVIKRYIVKEVSKSPI